MAAPLFPYQYGTLLLGWDDEFEALISSNCIKNNTAGIH
jgi:hypothetical protein